MSNLIKSFRINDDEEGFKLKPFISTLQRMESDEETTSGETNAISEPVQVDPSVYKECERLLSGARSKAAEEANLVLQQAREEANAIIAQANADADAELHAAKQRAADVEVQLRKNIAVEATENARHNVMAQADKNLSLMNELLESAKQERTEMLDGAKDLIIAIALASAGKLIMQKLEADRSITVKIVEKLIERAKSGKELRIRCSPLDISVLHERSDMLARMAGGKTILIEGDKSIELGGVIIESEFGILDGSIESQLKEIALKLQEEFGHVV